MSTLGMNTGTKRKLLIFIFGALILGFVFERISFVVSGRLVEPFGDPKIFKHIGFPLAYYSNTGEFGPVVDYRLLLVNVGVWIGVALVLIWCVYRWRN